ncbi:hypothetical protein [Hymenobacter jejuensis]|uniref:Uncharacterized protein n=1 Tax=Hymenobacter jejuensis TaxID=2502781 RepID=A0A5B7ZZY7_9BACT|nr:hypothetical protein [Hymenobacter jejuensis]QDA60580.1 hypothetical protein FHG12_10890 [Hymenobacter jejuensis]
MCFLLANCFGVSRDRGYGYGNRGHHRTYGYNGRHRHHDRDGRWAHTGRTRGDDDHHDRYRHHDR